eukprot:203665-Amorphochlora_amoeboformis.AAC.1
MNVNEPLALRRCVSSETHPPHTDNFEWIQWIEWILVPVATYSGYAGYMPFGYSEGSFTADTVDPLPCNNLQRILVVVKSNAHTANTLQCNMTYMIHWI